MRGPVLGQELPMPLGKDNIQNKMRHVFAVVEGGCLLLFDATARSWHAGAGLERKEVLRYGIVKHVLLNFKIRER